MGSCNHTHIKELLLHFSTLLNGKLYNLQIKITLHSSYCLPFNFPPLFLKTFVDGLRNGRLHQINVTYNQWCKCVSQVLVEPPILEVVYQTSKYFYSVRFTQMISSRRQVFRLHQWRCSQFCMHNKIHTVFLHFVDHASRYKFLSITNLMHSFMHFFIFCVIRRSNYINTLSSMISLCK